jgi:hypothetical protein
MASLTDRIVSFSSVNPLPHSNFRTSYCAPREQAGFISGHHLLDLFILVKLSLLLGGSILSNAEVKYA